MRYFQVGGKDGTCFREIVLGSKINNDTVNSIFEVIESMNGGKFKLSRTDDFLVVEMQTGKCMTGNVVDGLKDFGPEVVAIWAKKCWEHKLGVKLTEEPALV